MDQAVVVSSSQSILHAVFRFFAIGIVALLLCGNTFGQSSVAYFVPSSGGNESESKGDGRSYSAFQFVGQNSAFKENYVMSQGRVAGTLSVEVDSRSEKTPPNRDEVRKYLAMYGLKGAQLERAVDLTLAADATVREWIRAVNALNLPDKRLAELAVAADQLRLAQFRLEGQLYERWGQADRMNGALDAFAKHLESQTSR